MRLLYTVFLILLFVKSPAQAVNPVIYFAAAKSDIPAAEIRWMDSVFSFLSQASSYSIVIWAYSDSDGTEASNLLLSEQRANSVNAILLKNKIKEEFITLNFLGEKDPVVDNFTEEGKAKNRRVHLAIIYDLKKESVSEMNTEFISDSSMEKLNVSPDFSGIDLKVGQTLVLKNINFKGGTPVLLPESEPALKKLLKIMKDNPAMEIEIGGHVCCANDMPLSVMRAQKVYNYLKGYGISTDRMNYKGYSHDKPVASEATEEGRIANRRVEIKILKIN